MNLSQILLRYLIGIFFSLLVMFLDTRGVMGWFRGGVETMMKPELQMLGAIHHAAASSFRVIQFSFQGRRELLMLRQETIQLQQQLFDIEQEQERQKGLTQVLGSVHGLTTRPIPVQVIARGTALVIENVGFSSGQPVLSPEGVLVGIIENVGTWVARVRLLTDVRTTLGVSVILPDGEHVSSELHGAFGASMTVEKIPADVSLSKGDIVVTQDQADTVPHNIMIGRIGSLIDHRESAVYQSARVDPMVDMSLLSTVVVMK